MRSLAALMYHRVGLEKHANSLELLRAHFKIIKETFPVVLPGEQLHPKKQSVLLTFDDATFDFYAYIFPLLKEFNLRVLLGVPVSYILDKTTLPSKERLSVPYPLMMQEGIYEKKVPFCTWEELREMVQSGLVEVASHSYSHSNLTFSFVDLEREIVFSKQVIEDKLYQAVSSFIYPFGKTNGRVHDAVSKHYPFAFRIGSALNFGWGKGTKPLSRISCDNLKTAFEPFTFYKRAQYLFNALI